MKYNVFWEKRKLTQNRPEHCITPFRLTNFCGGFALNALWWIWKWYASHRGLCRIQDYQNKEIIERIRILRQAYTLLGNKSS